MPADRPRDIAKTREHTRKASALNIWDFLGSAITVAALARLIFV
jgi:hypothetical protein